MARIGCLVVAWLAVVSWSSAPGQDRIEKLIEILKKKGIEFTAEELKELEQAEKAVPAGPIGEREIEQIVDRALEERRDAAAKLELPGLKSLKISGENRIRGELRSNWYNPLDPLGQDDLDWVRMRNRIRFDVGVNDHIDAIIELQDIRYWGQSGATVAVNTFNTGVDLKRGEVIFKHLFESPFEIEAGRYVMAYGDQRLIGHLEWLDQGRSYDGLRLRWNEKTWYADLFGVKVREVPIGNNDLNFAGIYAGSRDADSVINGEGYFLLYNDQLETAGETGTGRSDVYTIGGRIFGKADIIEYSLEAAYQGGKWNGDTLKAYAWAAKVNLNLQDAPLKPNFLIEVDNASGDDDTTDGDQGTFRTLFPTNHIHYGYADLLAWMNMWDIRLGFGLWLTEGFRFSFDYHHMRLMQAQGGWYGAGGGLIRTGTTGDSRYLGDEIDFELKWQPWKPLNLLLGWAHFFEGPFVRDTGGGGDSDLLYLQSHVRF